jgi:transcriptional regulator with XRE-family HTH domain
MNYKTIRQMKRIKQLDLARATGISQTKLSLWENGYGNLTADELSRVRAALCIKEETE